MIACVDQLLQSIRQVNLFKRDSSSEDSTPIERCSSWIYIALFTTLVTSVAMHTALDSQETTATINNPSRSKVEALQDAYPTTVSCPCATKSIRQSTFIQINVTFHQICSSSFITDEWIIASFSNDAPYYWPMDARKIASSYTQGLRFLCQTSQNSVNSRIETILSGYILSAEAQTRSELGSIDALETVVNEASKRLRALALIFSKVVSIDMAITALGAGAVIYYSPESSNKLAAGLTIYRKLDTTSCFCFAVLTCQMPAAIYSTMPPRTFSTLSIDPNATSIKGMSASCYPFDGLLASTLECYYNRSCLELLVGNTSAFIPLDAALPSRYGLEATVYNLINVAMIEKLSQNFSSQAYHTQCAPKFCVYSYRHRKTFLTIITAIIAVVKTLNSILRLIIPFLVRLTLKCWGKLRSPSLSVQSQVDVPKMSSDEVAQAFQQKLLDLWKSIKLMNLFNSNSIDVNVINRERKMTGLYLILLVCSLITLVLYNILSQRTHVHTVYKPSEIDYLNLLAKSQDSLECPCAQKRVKNDKIVKLNVIYHQICSSQFTAGDYFENFINFDKVNIHKYDFMTSSASYFLHLYLYCQFVTQYVGNSFIDYLQKDYVVSNVPSPNAFEAQIESFVMATTRSIKLYINHTFLDLIQLSSKSYGMLNIQIISNITLAADRSVRNENNDFLGCSCITSPDTCSTDAAFYNYTRASDTLIPLFNVEGARLGCSPTRSTLQSSLACWYSPECYSQVDAFWRSRAFSYTNSAPLLNASNDFHFKPSDSIMNILQDAMIDRVSYNSSYSTFFSECAALYCTYSLRERQSLVTIIINLMGICGGLSVALHLLTPILFHVVYWPIGFVQGRVDLHRLIRGIPLQLFELNFFFNRRKSSSLTILIERRATWLYIFTWMSIFTTLFLYNYLAEETNRVEVRQLDEKITSELFTTHGTSLDCPCSETEHYSGSFVDLSIRLHQVCSSPFIEDAWIQSVYRNSNWSKLPSNQFRGSGVVYFVVQQSICHIAQRAIDRLVIEFFRQALLIENLLSEKQLVSQINLVVDSVRNWNRDTLVTLLQFSRGGIQTSQLVNIFFTNWMYPPQNYDSLVNYAFVATPVSHGEACSCATSSACTEPVYIDGQVVPGLVLGCNPIESLFRSTLSCFYNETCVQLINLGNPSPIQPLDPSLSDRFHPDDTVEELISEALIDKWSINISYSKFFSVCAPSLCTYSISERKPILQVVTIVLGLYGGLTFILRFIVPRLVIGLQKAVTALQRRKDRVIPFTEKTFE